jgi:hypothetical protein
MRGTFVATLAVMMVLVLASASVTLEKTALRVTDLERPNEWNPQSVCTVAYYNYCTGWIWVWGGWSPTDVIGVCYDDCCNLYAYPGSRSVLMRTWELVYTAAPPGYCFTGVIEVWDPVDDPINRCPVNLLAAAPFYFYSGWNGHSWGISVSNPFVVTVSCGYVPGLPSRFASDRPAAGPTGPQACGYCYPMPRTCHSYYYGTVASPLCPGSTLTDGICCAEWIWYAGLACPIAVRDDSWANIKALYR